MPDPAQAQQPRFFTCGCGHTERWHEGGPERCNACLAQQQTCGDGYPFPYTTAQGFAGERRCELQPGHDGYHLWQQCQWPPVQQQDMAAVDLQAVMDKLTSSGQWSRADVVPLANEINSLRAQLATAEAERERWDRQFATTDDYTEALREQRDQLRAQVEAMRATLKDFANPDHWVRDDNEQWIWHGYYPPFERPAIDLLARPEEQPSTDLSNSSHQDAGASGLHGLDMDALHSTKAGHAAPIEGTS